MYKILSKYFVWLIIPAFVYLGVFCVFPAFNVIDDGASINSAVKLSSSSSIDVWKSVLVESQVGRLRPLYLLYFFIVYSVVGANPLGFWMFQLVVLSLTLIGMAIFIYKVTNSYLLSSFVPVVLLFFEATAENFFRLGTAEPKQVLLWIWLLLAALQIKVKGLTVFRSVVLLSVFIAALLLKETSVVFGGVFGFLVVWEVVVSRKMAKPQLGVLLLSLICVVLYVLAIPKTGAYSSAFHFEVQKMLSRLLLARTMYSSLFFPVFVASCSLLVRAGLTYFRKISNPLDSFFWQLLLLSQFLLVLIVGILPWEYQMVRYFYPLYVSGLLLCALEFGQVVRLLAKNEKVSINQSIILTTASVSLFSVIESTIFRSGEVLSLGIDSIWHQVLVVRFELSWLLLFFSIVLGLTVVRMILRGIFNKKKIHYADELHVPLLFCFAFVVSMLSSQLIWKTEAFRSSITLVVIVLGYLYSEIHSIQFLRAQAWSKQIGVGKYLAFYIPLLVSVMLINSYFFQGRGLNVLPVVRKPVKVLTESFDTHQVSYQLIDQLITDTQTDQELYIVSEEYEIIFELGLYASNFGARPVQVFTTSEQLVADVGMQYTNLKHTSDPMLSFVTASEKNSNVVLLLRKGYWDYLQGMSVDVVLPLYVQSALTATDWHKYSAREFRPKVSFGTVPSWANWVAVRLNQ